MSGPKIVAAMFGAALLLTVAWNYAAQALLAEPMRQAVRNAEALGDLRRAPLPAGLRDATSTAPSPSAATRRPPRTVGGAPSGWYSDQSWSAGAASNTSRNAAP